MALYFEHLAAAWRAVASGVPWRSLPPGTWPLVPVFTGRMLDRPGAKIRFGIDIVELVLFGLPSVDAAHAVGRMLSEINLPGSLGTWSDAPRPNDEGLFLPLTELITHDAVVLLGDDVDGVARGFDTAIGLQVVRLVDEDELIHTNMVSGDLDFLAPHLIGLIGRNLRSWINEPHGDASAERQLAHAQELLWANAPMLSAIIIGRALEADLRRRLREREGPTGAQPTMLGRIIAKAKDTQLIRAEDAQRMFELAELRNTCAHAVATDSTEDVGPSVEANLTWLREFIAR